MNLLMVILIIMFIQKIFSFPSDLIELANLCCQIFVFRGMQFIRIMELGFEALDSIIQLYYIIMIVGLGLLTQEQINGEQKLR